MPGTDLIAAWRTILGGLNRPWVLFEHGTCVVLAAPGPDLAAQARAILQEYGPAGDDSAVGDFAATVPLPDGRGWLVAGQHDDIVTFVGRDEVAPGTPDAAVGRLGRARREQDAADLRVMHVEDGRPAPAPAARRT